VNQPQKPDRYDQSEEPRNELRGIIQGKFPNGGCHPHPRLAIHPSSKLQGILTFSHKSGFILYRLALAMLDAGVSL
jgi:hypothetical protein